jgi:hypothetical protein
MPKTTNVSIHLDGGQTVDVTLEQLLALRAFDLVWWGGFKRSVRSRVFRGRSEETKSSIEAFIREARL